MINKPEKKAPKPHIGARVDHAVHAEILRLKESTGKTESELVNELLAERLGLATGTTVSTRMSDVESRQAQQEQRTEKRFEKLEQQVETILGKFQRLATR